MHLFRVQHVQALQLDDYAPRLAFSQWYFRKCATDPLFPAKVLFSDEASFPREEIFKTHNAHICAWAEANPLEYNVVQHRLIFGQCLGRYYRDYLIGRYLLPFCLTACNYFLLLLQVLQHLIDEQIFASTKQTM